ncbi:MAG TPA: iron ABC transporter permease [Gemmatimonadales bacterium]|jgi:iron complex transport system permease protein|nr:iron ABC transporter permease [Gemmatimonadales bacterium]
MRGHRWVGLGAVAVVACAAGVAIGAAPLALPDIGRGLLGAGGPAATVVRELRLPRVVLGFLIGGSLSVSGAALQALIRNPLAEPYLLGLSGGAALGAVAAIALGLPGAWSVPLAAFAGTLLVLALVYRLSLIEGRRLEPHVLVLAGVVMSALTGALVTAVLVLADAARLKNAYTWLLGGLESASWPAVLLFAGYAALPLGLLVLRSRTLDLLALGDEPARHLGADPDRARREVYLATGLLTAAAVAACGMIGFVGLIVPHAVRRLWGPLHRALLPAAFVLGGSFLVLADVLARSVARPLELPVGVVTALIGVPLFAVLLRRSLT